MRYIFDVKRGQDLSSLYKKRGILKITDRRKLHVLTQTHKILYNNCPEYLKCFVTTMRDVDLIGRSRAHRLRLLAPRVNVTVPEQCFQVQCYRQWNSLSPNLCMNENSSAFKKKIKEAIISSY